MRIYTTRLFDSTHTIIENAQKGDWALVRQNLTEGNALRVYRKLSPEDQKTLRIVARQLQITALDEIVTAHLHKPTGSA